MSRIANFIDAEYLDHLQRDIIDVPQLDYAALASRMSDGCDILRTSYYDCLPFQASPPRPEQQERMARKQSFLAELSRLPRFEVRLGQLEYRGRDYDGRPIYQQKRVDVRLAVDLANLAAKGLITDAAILAGDSDLIPAVEAAKAEGVVVRLFHGLGAHKDLISACDERVQLTPELFQSIQRNLPPVPVETRSVRTLNGTPVKVA